MTQRERHSHPPLRPRLPRPADTLTDRDLLILVSGHSLRITAMIDHNGALWRDEPETIESLKASLTALREFAGEFLRRKA